MFEQTKELGGLVKLLGYEVAPEPGKFPLATGNQAKWGHFIASCPFGLVVVEGPSRGKLPSVSTEVNCELRNKPNPVIGTCAVAPGGINEECTGKTTVEACSAASLVGGNNTQPCVFTGAEENWGCPDLCAGHKEYQGQQCIAKAHTPTSVKRSTGGMPGEPFPDEIKVAVVDFYNHVFKTARAPVALEAFADLRREGLGLAYDKFGGQTNCTQAIDRKEPHLCGITISPADSGVSLEHQDTTALGAAETEAMESENGGRRLGVDGGAAPKTEAAQVTPSSILRGSTMSVVPEAGYATFKSLTVHARPSSYCYNVDPSTQKQGSDPQTICTPSLYGFRVTSPLLLGPSVTAEPEIAIGLKECPLGKWLDMRPAAMRCEECPVGRFGDKVNFNLDGTDQVEPCNMCPRGFFQRETGQSLCDKCPEGRFASGEGQSSCKICKNGTHTNGTVGSDRCFGCGVGMYGDIEGESEDTSRAICLSCPVGRFQPYVARDDGLDHSNAPFDCWKCPMGFKQNLKGQMQCENCEAGRVSFEGGEKCDVGCFKGSFRDATGYPAWLRYGIPTADETNWRSNRSAYDTRVRLTRPEPTDLCVYCPTGYFSSGKANAKCHACSKGQYQNKVGKFKCEDCAKGDFTNVTGSVHCTKCFGGTYQDQKGQARCKACQTGTANQPRPLVREFFYDADEKLVLVNPRPVNQFPENIKKKVMDESNDRQNNGGDNFWTLRKKFNYIWDVVQPKDPKGERIDSTMRSMMPSEIPEEYERYYASEELEASMKYHLTEGGEHISDQTFYVTRLVYRTIKPRKKIEGFSHILL
jgi:hypothetical protein